MTHIRQKQLQRWLEQIFPQPSLTLVPLAGGASNRRFFRFYHQNQSYIIMDAPLQQQDNQRYVSIATLFAKLGIEVPKILAANYHQGFIWMTDLGTKLYYHTLNHHNVEQLYHAGLEVLLTLQKSTLQLPAFNRKIIIEGLKGFEDIFLQHYLKLSLSIKTKAMLHQLFERLVNNALAQPQVAMHRDYHCQNLLWLPNNTTGVVDFQDAKTGPLTYDVVSLLRDNYIAWPEKSVNTWLMHYHKRLIEEKIITNISSQQFIYWCDLMAMKRHLKSCFTFANKARRDQDHTYLKHLPCTLHYLDKVCQRYKALSQFHRLLTTEILPNVTDKLDKTL